MKRRRLAGRLRDLDLDLYRKFMEDQVAWLASQKSPGPAQEALAEQAPSPADPILQRVLSDRTARAAFLTWLGREGRERLLAGEPMGSPVGRMPPDLRDAFRQYVRNGKGRDDGNEALDRYSIVFVLARSVAGPESTRLLQTVADPRGSITRTSLLSMPGFHTAAFQRPPFRLPRRDPNDTSRKVSVILAPAAGPGAGGQVKRGFDEMVGDLVAGAGLDVVADGYLRAPISIPANFQVKEYPLA